MGTKDTVLSLGIGAGYERQADNIDFKALDKFVAMFLGAYLNRRGAEAIRQELQSDLISDTTIFLTRMIEVGTIQFLSENHLMDGIEEETNQLATVVAHGINISMASELQLNRLDQPGGSIFFAIDALYGLIERIIDHINNSRHQEGYIFSLVNHNLVNFVNEAGQGRSTAAL